MRIPTGVMRKALDRYAKGTVLFREGDEGCEMFLIKSGSVQITRQVGSEEMVLAILPAGEFVGEMSVVRDRPRSATATVVEEAVLLALDKDTFETMIHRDADLAMRIICKLSDRLERADLQIETLLCREQDHRVIRFLREQAQDAGVPHPAGIEIRMDGEELARRVSLSYEEVQEVLARLEKTRLLARSVDGKSLVIPRVGKLREFLELLEMYEKFGRGERCAKT